MRRQKVPFCSVLFVLVILFPVGPLSAQTEGVSTAGKGVPAPSHDFGPPIKLDVDATDAPRKLLHARLSIPAAPGPLTLVYPKWIPGEHGPTGPITDLAGVKMSAAGKPLPWRRDDVDMFSFHVEVPAGANAIDVALDFLLPTTTEGFSGSASATPNLVVLSWNQVLVYPAGQASAGVGVDATLKLPEGWKFGTALRLAEKGPEPTGKRDGGSIAFQRVSLETLVDSPVAAGAHFRRVMLIEDSEGTAEIDIVADSEGALAMSEDMVQGYKRLVAECDAMYGARHWKNYHFLLTLSDHVSHFGLEHHESSDDRLAERSLIDEAPMLIGSDLLPHEFTHAWNGKYRRPAGLATADYQQPMKGELLWVYEGLTEYLGEMLTARSGLWKPDIWRDHLASVAAGLERFPGRTWRPLLDTTVAAQLLYNAAPAWASHRRGVDFYDEGELIWLEADVLIRSLTKGDKSLNDFCRKFHGGKSGPPEVKPYGFDEVVSTMNEVAPYDWKAFFEERLTSTAPHAPLGGIENGGWKLVFTDEPSAYTLAAEAEGGANLAYSIGIRVADDGAISDVVLGTPADKAGLGPGMKILAVNGRRFGVGRIKDAIRDAKDKTDPIELMVENGDFFKTHTVDWHGGEQYPHLERDVSKPDVLSRIVKPLSTLRAPR